jgi:anthranilate synthase component 2/putative glutamine amidotransferase
VQHLPAVPETEPHQLGLGLYAERKVRTAPGSRLDAVLGPTTTANCHHHQALDRIAAELTSSAWAEDGVVEGVEAVDRRFCLGVQWHPETSEDRRLFGELVAAAAR